MTVGDNEVYPVAEQIARELSNDGFEVALDDRKERPGVKFADADLIGWPVQIVVGKRGLSEGNVEIKYRAKGEKKSIPLEQVREALAFARRIKRKKPVL